MELNDIAALKYSSAELNYFRICYITTNILPEKLREIFKNEWDSRYRTTLGEWEDTPRNGQDFFNREGLLNQNRNKRILLTMKQGNRAEWDCTMLFYAILYSDSITSLNATVRSTVDEMRVFRNVLFAHTARGQMSNAAFQASVQKVLNALQSLALSTSDVQEISRQNGFPTEELEALQQQLATEVRSFCVLPPKPSHQVMIRPVQVKEIIGSLEELKARGETGTTGLYIYGNPGSGKTQLARQVGEEVFRESCGSSLEPTFVMTLDGKSEDSFFESYVEFARQLKCSEYSITKIITSKEIDIKQKIRHLRTLISTKLQLYSDWLVVVDNVVNLTSAQQHWPQSGSEEWGEGQTIITTQDGGAVPTHSACVAQVNLSKGMPAEEAVQLLSSLSGLAKDRNAATVAETLDFQPLSLASAGVYAGNIIASGLSSGFSWEKYLLKLQEGRLEQMEEILSRTNPTYPITMTTAIKLSVLQIVEKEEEIRHALSFLAMCAPGAVSLDIVVQYAITMNNAFDSDKVKLSISKCSLITTEVQNENSNIKVHQVVRRALQDLKANFCQLEGHRFEIRSIASALISFSDFVDRNSSLKVNHTDFNYLTICKPVVPHLSEFSKTIECMSKDASEILKETGSKSSIDLVFYLFYLGRMIENLRLPIQAKVYYKLALKLAQDDIGSYKDLEAKLLKRLGTACHVLGEIQDSNEYFLAALKCYEQLYGEDSIRTCVCLNFLGSIAPYFAKYDDAISYNRRALSIQVRHLGGDHMNVAHTYISLGSVHYHLKEYQVAKEYYEKAFAIYERAYPQGSPVVGKSIEGIANCCCGLGETEKAIELERRALDMFEGFFGPNHLDVATALDNLGCAYRTLGQVKEAIEFHTKSLRIKEELVGMDNLGVLYSHMYLGADFRDLNQSEEAAKHLQFVASTAAKMEFEHQDLGACLYDLGLLHETTGELDSAMNCFKRTLEIYRKFLGESHEDAVSVKVALNRVSNNLQLKHSTYDIHQCPVPHDPTVAAEVSFPTQWRTSAGNDRRICNKQSAKHRNRSSCRCC